MGFHGRYHLIPKRMDVVGQMADRGPMEFALLPTGRTLTFRIDEATCALRSRREGCGVKARLVVEKIDGVPAGSATESTGTLCARTGDVYELAKAGPRKAR